MICPRCQFYETEEKLCETCLPEFNQKLERVSSEVLQNNKNDYDEKELNTEKINLVKQLTEKYDTTRIR